MSPEQIENDGESRRSETPPAAGERRAIGGYQPQYRITAGLILRRLRDRSLEWVRLADPDAGRMDDAQIATPGRLDAYQVKWSRFPGTFTFHQLITAFSDAPSLIAQLADGWRRLSTAHPGRRVVVHLVTNDRPSVTTTLPGAEAPGEPGHFAAFLAQAWIPRTSATRDCPPEVSKRWRTAWGTLVQASGLGEDEFDRFVLDCELDFNHVLPDDPQRMAGASDGSLAAAYEIAAWREDLDALNGLLFRIVAEPRGRVELTREDLLVELGWRDRTEFRSRHEFPDPTIPYREIADTARDLDQALSEHPGGYLILLGTPGSGKSTLLTRIFRYRTERVVRYYAFVPGSHEPNARRGESANFLHDLVLALDRQGFSAGDALARPDVDLLASRFHEQLRRIGADFHATGRKTLIVVDGLDHIAREQSPSRPLLADLPAPSQVPDGVYFVLGSQTDQLPGLPYEVADQIQVPSRRVEMRRLSRAAVIAIIGEARLDPVPDPDETERIVALSDGHPLALAYIVNRIRGAAGNPISEILAGIEPFRDRIDAQYLAHWREVENDRSLLRLLAKLARVRGAIDLTWVEAWADPDALYRLHSRFDHYFRREPDERWHFFHNSFRVFLLERTRALPGVSSSGGDAGLFGELAEHCAAAPEGDPVRWDELFYRSGAGDHDAVLAAATPELFRNQFFAGRPAELIEADALRSVLAAEARRDVLALARLVLCAAEFAQRGYHLEDVPTSELLLALGQARAAVDHVRDGNQLRVSSREALNLCGVFEAAGMPDEAERIFTLAEPLEVLTDPAPLSAHNAREAADLLEAWVRAAPRFRAVSQILAAVDRLRRQEDKTVYESAEEATRQLRARLRFELAGALRSLGRWADAAEVVSAWNPADQNDREWWFWSHVHGWREAAAEGEAARAIELFRAARDVASGWELDNGERVALAEGLLRLEGDTGAASALLEGVPQPDPVDPVRATSGGREFGPYVQRFVLNRLLGALGDRRALDEVVPTPQDPEREPLAIFERLVTLVARLYGKAWAGEILSGVSLALEAGAVLRYTSRRFDPGRGSYWVSAAARTELHDLLVRAAVLHGSDAVEALRAAYNREWVDPELGRRWPSDTIRAVVLSLGRAGADRRWVRAWIHRLERSALDPDDAGERLQSATEQFRAYVEIGDVEAARRVFQGLLRATFAVGHKDYQFTSWIEWAERANAIDPEPAAERLAHLAACMPAIKETDGARDAVAQLVRTAFRWHSTAGFALLGWCYEHGLLRFVDGLEVALKEVLADPAADVKGTDAVYRNFLLPLDTSPSPKAAHALADRLAQQPAALDLLAQLTHAVRTHAMPSSRAGLLEAIDASAASYGITPWTPVAPPRVEQDQETDTSRLTYFDGAPQTEEGIRSLATSIEAVRGFVEREREDSYFRWDRVLPALVSRLSGAEVIELNALFARHARRSAIRSLLATRLAETGDLDTGWQLAESALAETRQYAWREHYGDERLRALEAMVAVDSTRGHAVAFRTLVQDLTTRQVRPYDIALELHRIAPLLARSEPVERIWDEVARYTGALVEHAERTTPPVLPGKEAENEVVRFAAAYLDQPTNALAEAAQRTFSELLLDRHPGAVRITAECLDDPSSPPHALLVTIVAVAIANPEAAAPLAHAVAKHINSDRQDIRAWVRQLLRLVDGPIEEIASKVSPHDPADLPPVYHLAFDERAEVRRLREPESTDFLPPTSDAAELVAAFRPELDLIARIAGVQSEALYQRVAQLAGNAGSAETADAERDLRHLLDELDLRVPFRRPRALAVREAMARAAAELVDAGRIAPGHRPGLNWLLCDADPAALLLRPSVRPACIIPIVERSSSDYIRDGWTNRADTGASALKICSATDGGAVIAEETHLRWLDWKTPTEVRLGAIVPRLFTERDLRQSDDPAKEMCVHWSHVPLSEYLSQPKDTSAPVVLQYGYKFDTPVNRWLAFNPAVAGQLGWLLAEDGLFRWVDESGAIMIESVWWEDGFYDHRPPHFEDEVGRGWIVRASAAGWEAVREFYGTLHMHVVVHRTAREQNDTRVVDIEFVA